MVAAVLFIALAGVMQSDLKSDEVVEFYPTAAYLDQSGKWIVPIHGIVYEPEEDSLRRRALIRILQKTIGLDRKDLKSDIFQQRARLFLVDNERDKQIAIRTGNDIKTLSKSAANGHFVTQLPLSAEAVQQAFEAQPSHDGWLRYSAVLSEGDDRLFVGNVQFVGHEGISVISDIDDTIKDSNVLDKKELIKNTFVRPFQPASGMAELYAAAARRGWTFHYVSASPWQLYRPLVDFTEKEGFPRGTFHLRLFRLQDGSIKTFFTSSQPHKKAAIAMLLKNWPRRRFVLVGDSGEHDPEVYGDIARHSPERIAAILIRNVTGESIRDDRFQSAFRDIDAERCKLFTDPAAVAEFLQSLP